MVLNIHHDVVILTWIGTSFGAYLYFAHVHTQRKQFLVFVNFQVAMTPVILTFPLKTFGTSAVVQFILFNEVDAKDNWLVEIINDKEIVGQVSPFKNHINVELALNL